MENNHIICIDLKSFFASCECIRLNNDPFSYPLIRFLLFLILLSCCLTLQFLIVSVLFLTGTGTSSVPDDNRSGLQIHLPYPPADK